MIRRLDGTDAFAKPAPPPQNRRCHSCRRPCAGLICADCLEEARRTNIPVLFWPCTCQICQPVLPLETK